MAFQIEDKNFKEKLVMKKITLIFVLCFLMVVSSWAAKKVDICKANDANYIMQLNKKGSSNGSVFGLGQNDGFQLLRSRTDSNGITHVHYQQTYKGIPVWGMQTVVSTDGSNKVIKLHGNVMQGIANDLKSIPSNLNPAGALDMMKQNIIKTASPEDWDIRNEKSGTYIYVDNAGKSHLTYMVSFFADHENADPSRMVYFIDVKSGKIIYSYDNLQFANGTGPGGNLKVGYYYYSIDYPPFGVVESSGTCTMNTTDVRTIDLNHKTRGTTPYAYTCYENTHETINDGYCPLNDAQFFGQVVYDMYQDWFGVSVLPFQLAMKVHYKKNYENAFWDGSSMTFGDGYTTFYPLVALDVTAHEVSHGFTEYNSDLAYSGESGGINESFSDMAGEGAKYYMRGTNDFMVGYDIFKSPTGALRYMYDPTLDGRSIDNVADYTSAIDVHYSSGIYNKAFYLVATAPGWNTQMAFEVFAKANIDYWTVSTTFQQGAEGVVDAAADYGYSCQSVANAFAGVGIYVSCN